MTGTLSKDFLVYTVGMPDVAEELHGGRHERVVLGEFELGGEDAAFVGSTLGAFDEGFPDEKIIFGYWAGGDAIWGILGEVLVLLKKAL